MKENQLILNLIFYVFKFVKQKKKLGDLKKQKEEIYKELDELYLDSKNNTINYFAGCAFITFTNLKEQELSQLKNKLLSNSNQFKTVSENKTGFAITFRSINQDIIYPIVCNKKESISRLEEELYNEYPKYKEFNTYLTCNGVVLKRFKTVGENNIKKGDAIIVNIIE